MFVINCNHWIGYHVINELLENDYPVKGIVQPDYPDDLLMFFGRNSSFSITDSIADITKPVIIIGKYNEKIPEGNIYWINPPELEKAPHMNIIRVPMLFGEWMPMNENGCYIGKEFISFQKLKKEENALYVKEFAKMLLPFIQGKSKENLFQKEEPFRIAPSKLEKQIENVIKHYQLFKSFYIYPKE